jgi:hypothetical protein
VCVPRSDLDAAAVREPADAGIRGALRSLAALNSRLRELQRAGRAEQAATLRGTLLRRGAAAGGDAPTPAAAAATVEVPATDDVPGLE